MEWVVSRKVEVFGRLSGRLWPGERDGLFRDRLGAPDALYLDGVVSRLYAPSLNRDDGGMDMGPIVAIVRTPARNPR